MQRADMIKGMRGQYGLDSDACLIAFKHGDYAAADMLARETIRDIKSQSSFYGSLREKLSLAFYVFGEVRRRKGLQRDAKTAYQEAIKLDPELEYVKNKIRKHKAEDLFEYAEENAAQNPFKLTETGKWEIDGWTLKKFLGRGAYGHTYLAVNSAGDLKAIKIYQLRDDAIDDLKRLHSLPENYTHDEFLKALRQAISKEAMANFGMNLSREEKPYILLPESVISNVRGADGTITYATVNERLEGTLEQELNRGSYRNPRDCLSLMREILKTFAIVHKARPNPDNPSKLERRVHNDIKPDNVGLSLEGHVRAFDFGVATTVSSLPVGNYPNLSSLEMRDPDLRAEGPKPTPRSDMWQIGCLFANILTRDKPFKPSEKRKSPLDVMPNPERPKKHESGRRKFEDETRPELIKEEIPLLLDHLKGIGVPSGMVNIVGKCLALRGSNVERYNNAEEGLEDFNSRVRSIFHSFQVSDDFEYDAALKRLTDVFGADMYHAPIPKFISPILKVEVSQYLLGNICHRKMFNLTGGSNLVFGDELAVEGARDVSLKNSRDPHLLRLGLGFSVSFVGVQDAESPAMVKSLLEFAELYKMAEDYSKVIQSVEYSSEFHTGTTEEQNSQLEKIVRHKIERDDLVVKVGSRAGEFSDKIPGMAERLMKLNEFYRLKMYVGLDNGIIADMTDKKNFKDMMFAKKQKGIYPFFIIASSNDINVTKDAVERIYKEVAAAATPTPQHDIEPELPKSLVRKVTDKIAEKWKSWRFRRKFGI